MWGTFEVSAGRRERADVCRLYRRCCTYVRANDQLVVNDYHACCMLYSHPSALPTCQFDRVSAVRVRDVCKSTCGETMAIATECNRMRTRRCGYAGEKRRTTHPVLSSVGASGGLERAQTPHECSQHVWRREECTLQNRGGREGCVYERGRRPRRAREAENACGRACGWTGRAGIVARPWRDGLGKELCPQRRGGLHAQMRDAGGRAGSACDGLSES